MTSIWGNWHHCRSHVFYQPSCVQTSFTGVPFSHIVHPTYHFFLCEIISLTIINYHYSHKKYYKFNNFFIIICIFFTSLLCIILLYFFFLFFIFFIFCCKILKNARNIAISNTLFKTYFIIYEYYSYFILIKFEKHYIYFFIQKPFDKLFILSFVRFSPN